MQQGDFKCSVPLFLIVISKFIQSTQNQRISQYYYFTFFKHYLKNDLVCSFCFAFN